MKVKTFAVIATLLFLLSMLAIAHYAKDLRPDTSAIATPAATEEPDHQDDASTVPELLPDMALPDVNESPINLTPVTLSESNNVNVKFAGTPTPTTEQYSVLATPTPTTDPRSAPMTPMKPMEPWKPATPMMP